MYRNRPVLDIAKRVKSYRGDANPFISNAICQMNSESQAKALANQELFDMMGNIHTNWVNPYIQWRHTRHPYNTMTVH